MSKTRILFSAGEVSGDLAGAALAEALRATGPDLELIGVGGDRMRAAGVDLLLNSNHLGSVGITEPLATTPGVWRAFQVIRRSVLERPPDAAVLIGQEVFNMLLARWLRTRGVRTFAYFPPQVWLWQALARPIARCYDCILTCFPDEHRVYEGAGGPPTRFVGHYLLDQVQLVTTERQSQARRSLGLSPRDRVVGVFPGSRRDEVEKVGPAMLDAVRRLAADQPTPRFVLPIADPFLEPCLREMVSSRRLEGTVSLVTNSRDVLAACDVALLCSGTVTLEAAIMGVPSVAMYRLSAPTWWIVQALCQLRLINGIVVAMPNLLTGSGLTPELLQDDATAENAVREVSALLARAETRAEFRAALREPLATLGGPGASARAARWIVDGIRATAPAHVNVSRETACPVLTTGGTTR
jgi:lipid-A-disaccharide synthase